MDEGYSVEQGQEVSSCLYEALVKCRSWQLAEPWKSELKRTASIKQRPLDLKQMIN